MPAFFRSGCIGGPPILNSLFFLFDGDGPTRNVRRTTAEVTKDLVAAEIEEEDGLERAFAAGEDGWR